MTISVKSYDGILHEFPDDTPDSVIDGVMRQYVKDNPAPTPFEPGAGPGGRGVSGAIQGLIQEIPNPVKDPLEEIAGIGAAAADLGTGLGGMIGGAVGAPVVAVQETLQGRPRTAVTEAWRYFEDAVAKSQIPDTYLGGRDSAMYKTLMSPFGMIAEGFNAAGDKGVRDSLKKMGMPDDIAQSFGDLAKLSLNAVPLVAGARISKPGSIEALQKGNEAARAAGTEHYIGQTAAYDTVRQVFPETRNMTDAQVVDFLEQRRQHAEALRQAQVDEAAVQSKFEAMDKAQEAQDRAAALPNEIAMEQQRLEAGRRVTDAKEAMQREMEALAEQYEGQKTGLEPRAPEGPGPIDVPRRKADRRPELGFTEYEAPPETIPFDRPTGPIQKSEGLFTRDVSNIDAQRVTAPQFGRSPATPSGIRGAVREFTPLPVGGGTKATTVGRGNLGGLGKRQGGAINPELFTGMAEVIGGLIGKSADELRQIPKERLGALLAQSGQGKEFMKKWAGTFQPRELAGAISNAGDPASRHTIVLMSPDDFHALAKARAPGVHDLNTLWGRSSESLRESIRGGLKDPDGLRQMPQLTVESNGPNTIVMSHEGRHRMDVFKEQGIELVPVIVTHRTLRWGQNPERSTHWVSEDYRNTVQAPDSIFFPKEKVLNNVAFNKANPSSSYTPGPAGIKEMARAGDVPAILKAIENDTSGFMAHKVLSKLIQKLPGELPRLHVGEISPSIEFKMGRGPLSRRSNFADFPLESGTIALYEPVSNTITLHPNLLKGDSYGIAKTVLHEILHSKVLNAQRYFGLMTHADLAKLGRADHDKYAAVKDMETLWNSVHNSEAIKGTLKNDKGEYVWYGLTSEIEFVAEAFSNPAFQAFLDKQKLSANQRALYSTYKPVPQTVFDAFITDMMKIFGWHGPEVHTALEAALRVGAEIMATEGKGASLDWITRQSILKDPQALDIVLAKEDMGSFKDSLPEHLKQYADSLWEQRQKNNAATLTKDSQQVSIDQAVAGLKSLKTGLNRMIPLNKPYKEIAPILRQEKDIPGHMLEKLGQQLVSGGKVYSDIKNNAVLRYVADTVNNMVRTRDATTFKMLRDPEMGMLVPWEKLNKQEQARLWQTIVAPENFRIRRLTDAQMDGYRFSPAMKDAYNRSMDRFRDIATLVNALREDRGLKPMDVVEGYWPARWGGNYYFEVWNADPAQFPEAKMLRVEARDFEGSLKEIRNRFVKEHPEYFATEVKSRPRRGDAKEVRDLFDSIVDALGSKSLEAAELHEIFSMYGESQAARRKGYYKHFQPTMGVEGFQGRRLEQSPHKAALDALNSAEGYVVDAMDYVATQRTYKDINALRWDKELNAPNAKQWAEKYWNHAQGIETPLARIINRMMEYPAEEFGLPRRFFIDGAGAAKNQLMLFLLGYWRPVFLFTQAFQPFQFMGARLQYLEVLHGKPLIELHSAKAMVHGLKDWYDWAAGKMDKDATKVWEYAHENRLVDPHFLEDIKDISGKRTREWLKWVNGQKGLQGTETAARMLALFQAYRFFQRMKVENAIPAAADTVDAAMTNYMKHERAMLYGNLGIAGKMMSPLTTFKHNFFSQMYFYGKEVLKNMGDPDIARFAAPLATFLTAQYLVAGLMGMPGREDIDWIINMLRNAGLIDPRTPNLTQKMLAETSSLQGEKRDLIRYGGFSALTGADVSPSFASAQLIPDEGWSSLFLIPGKAAEMVGAAWPLVKETAKMPFGGEGPTSTQARSALKHFTPPGLKWIEQAVNQDPKTGMLRNPDQNMAGTVKRGPFESSYKEPEWLTALAGSRVIPESEQSQAVLQSKRQEQAIEAERSRLIDKAVEKLIDGKPITEEAQKYLALGGSMAQFQKQLVEARMKQYTTSYQRERGLQPKTPGQIQKYQRIEEQGARQ